MFRCALGGPKQRALVALLLLHANDVVPLDRLIDELWEGAPPPSAPAYVQNCVSRLRKVLGAESSRRGRPATGSASSPRRSTRAASSGSYGRRAGCRRASGPAALREALGLWRGDAAVRPRLLELRAGSDPPSRGAAR